MIDVGLYVHVPFCSRKCGYCDFYSIVPEDDQVAPLISAICEELDSVFSAREFRVETIYVGGGTPTSLPESQLRRLLEGVRQATGEAAPVEFTIEANPATLNPDKAEACREFGIDRVSMGAQSFDQHELKVLERQHEPADVAASAEIIRQAGFAHFNLDLIFGIPGQTIATWADSLGKAVDIGPDHLACYGLTYEPGTPLHADLQSGRVTRADEDLEADLYLATIDQLTTKGFEQYEISNFSKPGGRSRHNLRYWQNQPTIGVGPAAASYLDGSRWRNLPDVSEYVRRTRAGLDCRIDRETLSPRARAAETAMLGLRLADGFDKAAFLSQTTFDPDVLFRDVIDRHDGAGLLDTAGGRLRLTRSGRLVADMIIADFLAAGRP
jgi:oxygen-independent coproporphyrinogen-3 oxidase